MVTVRPSPSPLCPVWGRDAYPVANTREFNLASLMQFSNTDVVTRPGIGSMPKEYREVCNLLIDHGWTFVPSDRGRKHRLYPPNRESRPVGVPSTPSDKANGFAIWVGFLRRSGARIDNDGKSLYHERSPEAVRQQSDRELMAAVADKIDPDLAPITTHGAWWRSFAAQAEIPVPAPEPPAEAVEQPRRYAAPALSVQARFVGPDAQGPNYGLTQAYALLRQGYHVNKVVAKTGWGRNWFKDMVDDTGYIRPATM